MRHSCFKSYTLCLCGVILRCIVMYSGNKTFSLNNHLCSVALVKHAGFGYEMCLRPNQLSNVRPTWDLANLDAINLQKNKHLYSVTSVFQKQVGRDTDPSALTFKPLGNRRRFLFILASSQLPEGTLRPSLPTKFCDSNSRLISSCCDFIESFSANSLR